MRIRSYTRIGGAITVVTLILAGAAAAFTWQSMDQSRSSAARQSAVKDLLLGFSETTSALSHHARRVATRPDPTPGETLRRESEDLRKREQIVVQLQGLGLTAEEQTHLAAVKRSADTLVGIERMAIRVGSQGDIERARQLLFDQAYEAQRTDLANAMHAFQVRVNARMSRSAESARQRAEALMGLTLAAVGLLAVCVIYISFGLIQRRVIGPIGRLHDVVEDLAEGQLDAVVPCVDQQDEIGVLARSISHLRDKEIENKKLRDELERLATTDPLTGASNRRAFMDASDLEIKRARRYGGTLAVVMADIDYFKRINDTFGHAAGDQALKAIVRTFRGSLRPMDVLGRLGGEEFAILLPGVDAQAALRTAERLRSLVKAIVVTAEDNREVRFTVSFGVAMLEPGEETIEQALRRSDAGLYAAKAAGRDCVVMQPA
ncbi:MAG: diguanylate cyclase [Alphaproteobacteria bacterium]|nr:diguanylate cyclase [Alphaproteobacteria bacterium]